MRDTSVNSIQTLKAFKPARLRTCLTLLLSVALSSCGGSKQSSSLALPSLHCPTAERFAGQVVGNGECVSLIKLCAQAPNTEFWRPGPSVYAQSTWQAGTIIATFKGDKYPSRTGYHAAIYISHDQEGIWVWDQWRGKPVHKRLIRWRSDKATPNNTAQHYRVVKLANQASHP